MRSYFEEAEIWQETKQKLFRHINQRGLPLVLFGRSFESNPAFLREIQVPLEFICSTYPTSWGTKHWGLEVVGPAKIAATYPAYTLLSLALEYDHAFPAMFRQFPVPPANIYQLDLHYERADTAGYFENMRPVMEEISKHMADQQSKETYETVVRYRINRDPGLLVPIAEPLEEQYFPKTLGGDPFLDDREAFVDVGAYTGDTVHRFVSAVHGRYRRVDAFEPDPQNYQCLVEDTKKLPGVFCHPFGVGREAKTESFASRGNSSKILAAGKETISVDTLDHLLADMPVSYIKMDVEGMECAALEGAKQLIQNQRPKLAICMYHSNADMVTVPQFILQLNPNYRLYCRQYTHAITETVCYAI